MITWPYGLCSFFKKMVCPTVGGVWNFESDQILGYLYTGAEVKAEVKATANRCFWRHTQNGLCAMVRTLPKSLDLILTKYRNSTTTWLTSCSLVTCMKSIVFLCIQDSKMISKRYGITYSSSDLAPLWLGAAMWCHIGEWVVSPVVIRSTAKPAMHYQLRRVPMNPNEGRSRFVKPQSTSSFPNFWLQLSFLAQYCLWLRLIVSCFHCRETTVCGLVSSKSQPASTSLFFKWHSKDKFWKECSKIQPTWFHLVAAYKACGHMKAKTELQNEKTQDH